LAWDVEWPFLKQVPARAFYGSLSQGIQRLDETKTSG
jgi:hypothetical protein